MVAFGYALVRLYILGQSTISTSTGRTVVKLAPALTSFLSLCAYDYRRARAAIPLGHLVVATLMVEEFCPGGLPSGVWAVYCTDYKVAQFNLVIAFLIV